MHARPPTDVPIRGDMIRLGQFLQLAGAVDGGGEAKAVLAEEAVTVNGEVETRRGRQLHPGDLVVTADGTWQVAAISPPASPEPG